MPDFLNSDLSFLKGSVYKDMRKLGGNAFRDIKMGFNMGTTSELVHYLKPYSNLLKNSTGNEKAVRIYKGAFSYVYLFEDSNGDEFVVKRSIDSKTVPGYIKGNFYIPLPRFVIKIFFPEYDITPATLERDRYDYEEIIKPYWGEKRIKLTDEKFIPFINSALWLADSFIPIFSKKDLHSKEFWERLIKKNKHKNLDKIIKYFKSIEDQKTLIPEEERFVFYEKLTNSLQTIFIQKAKIGKKEILPGKRMAFPFEVVTSGTVFKEMPKLMLEQLLRTIEIAHFQTQNEIEPMKVPDFRPLEDWKVFPPTPVELYFFETCNLILHIDKENKLNLNLVDTHLLLEREGNYIFRWVEKRYWTSIFLNLRFWIKKALSFA